MKFSLDIDNDNSNKPPSVRPQTKSNKLTKEKIRPGALLKKRLQKAKNQKKEIIESVKTENGLIPIFNYGSNSRIQLMGRLGVYSLKLKRAFLENYARVFCDLGSSNWAMGSRKSESGLATIAPSQGTVIYGSVVYLTLKQLEIIDRYEGIGGNIYRHEVKDVNILEDSEETYTLKSIVYVANDVHGTGHYTNSRFAEPTEAYLCSIWATIREFWVGPKSIEISYYDGKNIVLVRNWFYPGMFNLSLPSLIVEANNFNKPGEIWSMPSSIKKILTKLRTFDIYSTSNLLDKLEKGDNIPYRNVFIDLVVSNKFD